jgi:GNAT superfamily N-acetyltransferase
MIVRYANVPELGQVEFGPMLDIERGFVLHSFVHGYVDALGHSSRSGSPHRHAYLVSFGREAERLLDTGADVIVARDAECEKRARAYGWVMFDAAEDAVHWVSVKQDFRKLQLGSLLLQAAFPHGASWYTLRSRFDRKAEALGMRYRVPSRRRRSA